MYIIRQGHLAEAPKKISLHTENINLLVLVMILPKVVRSLLEYIQ